MRLRQVAAFFTTGEIARKSHGKGTLTCKPCSGYKKPNIHKVSACVVLFLASFTTKNWLKKISGFCVAFSFGKTAYKPDLLSSKFSSLKLNETDIVFQ